MLIYSPHITPRLRYTIDFFSKELFDSPLLLTQDLDQFRATIGPRINYSEIAIPGAFQVRPSGLLFATGISPQTIECFRFNNTASQSGLSMTPGAPHSANRLIAFFPTGGDFPFDIFSAAFYLLSRYEEYLPHEKDMYGRYAHTNSLAFKEGFLDTPLINFWLQELKTALWAVYPELSFRYTPFKFIPTYDIDVAYSYRHKGWKRNLGGGMKELIKGQWAALKQRIDVLAGKKPDPFDAYEWLDSLHLYCRMKPYYFFLAAAHSKGVDKNIPPSGKGLQELVQYHAGGYRVGIHPSWQSGDDEQLLREELEWMETMTEKTITRSRQHYIRFTLPGTFRRLQKYGIDQEFSMGYGSINGFRASVASSFYWYDLEKEKETNLRLFPFCFMDANSFYEQGDTPAEAMTQLMHYYRQIRRVNGLMVTIWHNSFLGSDNAFPGWRKVYEVFLKEEIYWGA